jgi:deoxyribonuclease-1
MEAVDISTYERNGKSEHENVTVRWITSFLRDCCLAGGQTVIANYATAQRDFFWTKLYPSGGRDLYCNVRFITGQRLTVEHAYAADWIATHHGCPNRNECPIPAYGFAEGDLHNLWPAIGAINSSRGDKTFGEIPGNKPTLPPSVADLKCDYERTTGADAIVEPRDAVKGEIARSLFYMHVEYGLDLKGMLRMLKRWNVAHSPNAQERSRNNRIEQLEGTRINSLISHCWQPTCNDSITAHPFKQFAGL